MRPEVVRSLRCPVCHDPLSLTGGVRGPLRCPRGHSFDQARQGYVQLTAAPLAVELVQLGPLSVAAGAHEEHHGVVLGDVARDHGVRRRPDHEQGEHRQHRRDSRTAPDPAETAFPEPHPAGADRLVGEEAGQIVGSETRPFSDKDEAIKAALSLGGSAA